MLKTCSECKKEYPSTSEYFYKNTISKDRLSYWCKNCRKEYQKEYSKKNPEKFINKILKNRYGISLEEYNQLLESQNNVCAICSCKETQKYKGKITRLQVDHNHSTGEMRSLLCHSCNRGLECFKENENLMFEAIKYLRKFKDH